MVTNKTRSTNDCNNNNDTINDNGHWGKKSWSFSLPGENEHSHPPESGVAPLGSASNRKAIPVRVTTNSEVIKYQSSAWRCIDYRRKCRWASLSVFRQTNVREKTSEIKVCSHNPMML